MPDTTTPRPNPNTYWVIPGKFVAGEYPGAKDVAKAREKMNQFLATGVRHFIDLTESGELVPYDSILSEKAYFANLTKAHAARSIPRCSPGPGRR